MYLAHTVWPHLSVISRSVVLPPCQRRRWSAQWDRLCELELGVKLVGWQGLVGRLVAMARIAALLLLPVLIESVFSITFFLPVNSRKCLREEIHKDVLVTGEYEISEQANTKTNLKVSAELRLATANRLCWGRDGIRLILNVHKLVVTRELC